jgi:transcriptional regulator with XRE-family HTH domain
MREEIGASLRRRRQAQGRTLREVAQAAGVSLTYLSEVERGLKEASSEVLAAICAALGVVLSELLFEVAEALARLESDAKRARGSAVGFLPPSVPPVPSVPEPQPAATPMAKVLDFQAFASRRSA